MFSKSKFTILFLLISILSFSQVTTKEKLQKHVTFLASDSLEGRGLGTTGKDIATAYIQEEFNQAKLLPFGDNYYLQEFPLRIGFAWTKAVNIIGIVEGADSVLKNEYIVLGAHYDHVGYELKKDKKIIYPGADDNASGVATIIELAKHFNKPENRPKRSLMFIAFDAEESGLLGSKHFINTIDENLRRNIKAMFSFDMVGMLKANKGVSLKGIGSVKNGVEIAEQNVGNDIVLLNKSSQAEERTDTAPFASKGIPAIHVFTGTKSPYHKPEDKADLLDYEGMNSIANYLAQIITDIGNQQDLEAITSYEKIRENKTSLIKRFSVGVVVNLGNGRHLYEDEFFNAKTAFSYSAGLQFNYKLTRITHLNIEGLYDYNASKSAEGKLNRQSVTIPLNIEFGTPTNSGKGSRLFIFAGPYYRYSFDGKNGTTKLDFDNVYSKNEWGYNFGVGADFNQLRIAYTYRQAFSSILENNGDIRAIGSYLTLGYRF
jgi:hypothetical protein